MNSRVWVAVTVLAACASAIAQDSSTAGEMLARTLALASNATAKEIPDRSFLRSQIENFVRSAQTSKERLDAQVVLAAFYLNTTDSNDVLCGRAVVREIIELGKDSWHSDWAYVWLAAADGLVGDHSNQVKSATEALRLVHNDRLESGNDPLLAQLMNRERSPSVGDGLRLMLVNAYCLTKHLSEAEKTCAEISDKSIRDRAQGLIDYAHRAARGEIP